MNQAFEIYWGIDVSKKWIDVDTGTQAIRIPQTEKTIKAFIKKHPLVHSKKLALLESFVGRVVAKQLPGIAMSDNRCATI